MHQFNELHFRNIMDSLMNIIIGQISFQFIIDAYANNCQGRVQHTKINNKLNQCSLFLIPERQELLTLISIILYSQDLIF
jgi:hypothetical protein